jgi:hypothetical protein
MITFPASPRGSTHQIAAGAVLTHNARIKDTLIMSSLFDYSTEPQAPEVYLGRSVHAGFIDLPFVTEEVLRDGRQDFGGAVPIANLSVDDLCALEATLDNYEADVHSQIAALRRSINDRAFVLDVTSQLPLGIAA